MLWSVKSLISTCRIDFWAGWHKPLIKHTVYMRFSLKNLVMKQNQLQTSNSSNLFHSDAMECSLCDVTSEVPQKACWIKILHCYIRECSLCSDSCCFVSKGNIELSGHQSRVSALAFSIVVHVIPTLWEFVWHRTEQSATIRCTRDYYWGAEL